jgi:two-component system, OmpR family, response regulator ResD
MMACRILIADDDGDIREVLRESLELEGYLVVEAADGRQALDIMVSRRDLCLVLLDLTMPNMSGSDFLRAKLTLPAYAKLPVVLLSATEPGADELVHTSGFLKKPTGLSDLMACVHRFCR